MKNRLNSKTIVPGENSPSLVINRRIPRKQDLSEFSAEQNNVSFPKCIKLLISLLVYLYYTVPVYCLYNSLKIYQYTFLNKIMDTPN